MVLFSIREQGIFEDLQGSKPRTSNCVLEAKDVLENSTSAFLFEKSVFFFGFSFEKKLFYLILKKEPQFTI